MKRSDVYICDDDRAIADMLGIIIESTGNSVGIETDSRLLYGKLEIERPKLLIIDLWMPNLTGDVIIRQLRSKKIFDELYILCISASLNGEQVAKSAGADQYLAKPFDIFDILEATENVLH